MIFDNHPHLYECRIRLFIMFLLIFLVGACAASPAGAPGKGSVSRIAVVPDDEAGLFTGLPVDAVMLNEGVSRLGLSDQSADYAKAREIFASLAKDYPKSKWRPLAETFIRLIGVMESLHAKRLSAQALTETLQRENEQIKKDIQSLRNKCQAEYTRLTHENEKLKKDMELLKVLEVQLDKREKMLR